MTPSFVPSERARPDADRLTAFFIDFENVYYSLKRTLSDQDAATDAAVRVVQRLRQHVFEQFRETTVSLDAYADFERIEDNAQGALYLPHARFLSCGPTFLPASFLGRGLFSFHLGSD